MNFYSRVGIVRCALLFFTVPSWAAESAPAPAAPTQSTVQAQFDAGAAALEARQWQKAFDIHAALEQQYSAQNPNAKSLPVIRLRKGRAMAGLAQEEAESAIATALETLPQDAPELADDRHLAWMALANIAEDRFDYPQAVERWHRAAEAAPGVVQKLTALLKALPLTTFVDSAAALKDADAAQALLDANSKRLSQEWAGLLRDYRGRILLNTGQLKAARAEFDASIKLLGGLTYKKVNLLDTAARSDAAIAALLDSDAEKARELLTYAGAPMMADQGFASAQDMNPPSCDIEGLKPEDVAVVEFSIQNDGGVTGVRPIYFSGKPALAVEFARAASQWSWNPEQLKRLGAFFRAQARIELRCTHAFKENRGEDLLLSSVTRWLEEQGLAPSAVPENLTETARLAALRTELQTRRTAAGETAPAALPTLIALTRNKAISRQEAELFGQQAYSIARTRGAKGEALAWLALQYWNRDEKRWNGWKGWTGAGGHYQRQLAQGLTDPLIVAEPRAEAAIRLALFDSLSTRGRRKEGRPILEPLVASQRLAAEDAFRAGAYIRLANLDYAEGNLKSARAQFEKSGIAAQQCALVDARPAPVSGNIGSFPEQERRWGLGGWTLAEFDVTPEGVPQGLRTLIAFPPFVFSSNSEKKLSAFRFQQTYRPGGEKGCVANRFRVKYDLKN